MKAIVSVLAACLALALGGCSSGGGSAGPASGATPGPSISGSPGAVAELTKDDLLDPHGNVTLYVGNESEIDSVDIVVTVDGVEVIDRDFKDDHAPAPERFVLRLAPGKQLLTARSVKGKVTLSRSFTVKDKRWMFIDYVFAPTYSHPPQPRQFLFRVFSEPIYFD